MAFDYDPDLTIGENWQRMVATMPSEFIVPMTMITPFLDNLDEAYRDLGEAQLTINAYDHALEVLLETYGNADVCNLLEAHGVPLERLGFEDDTIDVEPCVATE